MNNNNGHDELGGGESLCDSSTSIKQRLVQKPRLSSGSTGTHKIMRQAMVVAGPQSPQQVPAQLTSLRSLEGRRYRDILHQESFSASKENLNGVVVTSSKV